MPAHGIARLGDRPDVPEPGPLPPPHRARERHGRCPQQEPGQLRHRALPHRCPARGAATAPRTRWTSSAPSAWPQHALRPPSGLPYGTLKRIELARAMAARPELLLLDEPASGLTHAEVDELGETIRCCATSTELTILLVEHHMQLVMGISDKVVVLDFGRKIAEGRPEDVQNDPHGDRGVPREHRVTALLRGRATPRRLRAGPGPPRPRPARRRGRGRRPARRQRCRQDDDDAGASARWSTPRASVQFDGDAARRQAPGADGRRSASPTCRRDGARSPS